MHRAHILQGVIAKERAIARDAPASRNRLIKVAVHNLGGVPFARKGAANHFRQGDGPVPPSRASERDGQIALSFPDVMRDQIREQVLDPAKEFAGLWKGTDVASDATVLAAERAEAQDEVRVRQKPHVENKVRIGGNSVAEPEAYHRNKQRPAARVLKAIDDELAQFVNVEFRRVDNDVREAPDRGHPAAFSANAFGDRSAVAERMRAASLAEAA